ncbi:MAG: FG-GAP repeat domain-containing protein, partial [Bacteroidota bacterium]
MKISPHLLRAYCKSVRRYKKLASRLKKQVSSGYFSQQSAYTQREFLQRLRKLQRVLFHLRTQIKLATAAGAAVLFLQGSPGHAQQALGPFVQQSRINNPLREPIFFSGKSSPAVVDIDNDGDMDVVTGDTYGYLRFFKNEGTASKASFAEVTINSPFAGISSQNEPAPQFADLDKDGDKDLFIGTLDGTIRYYKNTGSAAAPTFVEETGAWDPVAKTGNPMEGLATGASATPVFVDFDKDNDTDVVIGIDFNDVTSVRYYANDGTAVFSETALSFTPSAPSANDLAPTFADLDNDGDLDMLTGSYYNGLQYYKRTGATTFEQQTGTGNPFGSFFFGQVNVPVFVDLDNDSDLDVLVGNGKYSKNLLRYLENDNGTFVQRDGLLNPFDGACFNCTSFNGGSQPYLTDFDGDGDIDAVIGAKYNFSELSY